MLSFNKYFRGFTITVSARTVVGDQDSQEKKVEPVPREFINILPKCFSAYNVYR